MAAGNWVPELMELANAENLFGKAALHSPVELGRTDCRRSGRISLPCGFDLKRTREEMYWLTERPGWSDLRAVRSAEVYLADGNQYLNRPGPRIVESLQILAEILHPDLFEPKLDGSGWERFVTLKSTHKDV